jgi:hypothetical protein
VGRCWAQKREFYRKLLQLAQTRLTLAKS